MSVPEKIVGSDKIAIVSMCENIMEFLCQEVTWEGLQELAEVFPSSNLKNQ